MKLMIDIPEDDYELVQKYIYPQRVFYELVHGTPIPDNAQPKTGQWIKISPAGIYECSECGQNVMTSDICAYIFCHGCGAKMVEPQERSDKA